MYKLTLTLQRTNNIKNRFLNFEVMQSTENHPSEDTFIINHEKIVLTIFLKTYEGGIGLQKMKKQLNAAYGILNSRNKDLISLERIAMIGLLERLENDIN